MYCKYCGSEIKGNFCSNCGRKVQEESRESSGFGYGVLGFFFPLIGFILFLIKMFLLFSNAITILLKNTFSDCRSVFLMIIVLLFLIAVISYYLIISLYFIFAKP